MGKKIGIGVGLALLLVFGLASLVSLLRGLGSGGFRLAFMPGFIIYKTA